MSTVTLPNSTREQAEAIIARRLARDIGPKTRLEEFGSVSVVQLLLDLEERFGILLDVDEVLPDGTIGGLVGLTLQRVRSRGPHEVTPCTLIDLADRRAERARRAQEQLGIPEPPARAAEPEPVALDLVAATSTALLVAQLALGSIAAGCAAGLLLFLVAPKF